MRATSAAAAAPNNRTIGGAGTGVGGFGPGGVYGPLLPDELEELDELDDELLLDPELPFELEPFDDQPPVEDELLVEDQPLLLDPYPPAPF